MGFNSAFKGLIQGADIVRYIKAQRIKWLGHIQRMDQARPTRKLLDWRPMGTRPVGRPRQRWQEDVMEDLKKPEVKNWKETGNDRRAWRDLGERAKTHKRLLCQMMVMMMMEYAGCDIRIHVTDCRRNWANTHASRSDYLDSKLKSLFFSATPGKFRVSTSNYVLADILQEARIA